jgi:hypothetical protein
MENEIPILFSIPRTRKAEAQVRVAVVRRGVVAVGASHVRRDVVPTAAADHPLRAAVYLASVPKFINSLPVYG